MGGMQRTNLFFGGMAVCAVVLGLTLTASADFLEDFESGWTGNGTLQADPQDASNTVLHLAPGELVDWATSDNVGTVTMRIYDFGEGGEAEYRGPRWGLRGAGGAATVRAIGNTARGGVSDSTLNLDRKSVV